MIHVERLLLPPELQVGLREASDKVIARYRAFVSDPQKRFDVSRYDAWRPTREFLKQVFHGKCAYCESRVGATGADHVDHFRPKGNALGLDGQSHPFHYVWFANTWENLYLVCRTCNMNKGNQFPLEDETRRIKLEGPIWDERPLLLDPCQDWPEEHLAFEEDGRVRALSRRGEVSVQIYGLNRGELVDERKRVAEDLAFHIDAWDDSRAQVAGRLRRMIEASAPFAGFARQYLVRRATQMEKDGSGLVPYGLELEDLGELFYRQPNLKIAPEAVSTPTAALTQVSYLQSVEIHNFRGLRDFELDLGRPPRTWTMLLGENASGKSSVLQAIALALLGEKGLQEVAPHLDFDRLLTNGEGKGHIRLVLSSEPEIIELNLQRGTPPFFTKGGEGVPSLVLAYGATRLMPRDSAYAPRDPDRAAKRVGNLFNPYVPLRDADAWLFSLPPDLRNHAVPTLQDLLHLDEARKNPFLFEKGRVMVDMGCEVVSLDQLSSGYQAILALGTDIMEATPEGLRDKKDALGIVLIDEIDAHLHPRWKMEVVRILRETFPSLQFLASTHEPLCLRGLKDKEIALMRRDEDRTIEVVTDLPSPENLRVDQLLTSALFGLHTTLDPEIDKEFRIYYAIRAKRPGERSKEERDKLKELRVRLGRHGVLGYTRRDQIVYELIDAYLALSRTFRRNGVSRSRNAPRSGSWRSGAASGPGPRRSHDQGRAERGTTSSADGQGRCRNRGNKEGPGFLCPEREPGEILQVQSLQIRRGQTRAQEALPG